MKPLFKSRLGSDLAAAKLAVYIAFNTALVARQSKTALAVRETTLS